MLNRGFVRFRRLRQQKILDILAGQQQGGLFFLARFMHARMYPMAVLLLRYRYSSSMAATVFPAQSSSIVHIAENIEQHRVAQVLPRFQQGFTPNVTNRPEPMLVWLLKYRLSGPTQSECRWSRSSRSVSSVNTPLPPACLSSSAYSSRRGAGNLHAEHGHVGLLCDACSRYSCSSRISTVSACASVSGL